MDIVGRRQRRTGIVQLKDYTPPPYRIEATRLDFRLDESRTEVEAELVLRRDPELRSPPDSLTLAGEELELVAVAIDGQPAAPNRYRVTSEGLTIAAPPEHFVLATKTRIRPEANTRLSGLYLSSGTYCTQCEAEGFRRITYYLDRPDVMARFTTRIEADRKRCPVLLSNGNLVQSGALEGDRHFAVWEDPFPKPSYLFALVAGELACREDEFRTRSGRRVPLRLYVEPHNVERTAHAMACLKRAMRWDEERFGREYDLETFMIVAVDDFNMGAMENKGLNIFNSKYILADPASATDRDFAAIEAVIGHEYFHNWTGDRVTLRDWFQLSLKEGLTVFREQSFAGDMGSPVVQRIRDVRFLREFQFAEDAGPMAHPVRPDHYVEINNFYTATVYEKGAEIARMCETLLEREGFRRGMDLYFRRHDGGAATTEDFLAAMADANGADLSQLALWYEVAGTPLLEVDDHYDEARRTYALELRQVHRSSPGQPAATKPPLLIPVAVALLGRDGTAIPMRAQGDAVAKPEHVLWLRDFAQRYTFEDVAERPIPSLLRGFSAPVELRYSYTADDLGFLVEHDSDPFNRWNAAQSLVLEALKGLAAAPQPAGGSAPPALLRACAATLSDESMDPALAAEILTLPSQSQLAQAFERVDVERLNEAWHGLRRMLMHALEREFGAAWERSRSRGPYRFDAAERARRRLAAVVLEYLGAAPAGRFLANAESQFFAADNMTDRLAALGVLATHDTPAGRKALASFRSDYAAEPLVLDKWFSIQATSPLPGALERVRELMNDPAFTLKNPNRVRSLIGAFAHLNHAGFHAADGGAYRFVADEVLAVDRLNPQVAARLVTCFAHWRRYDERRQKKMRTELERMQQVAALSRDVRDIVERTLA